MPLDINLPTFHLAPRPREPFITTLSYSSNGTSPQATYVKTISTEEQNVYNTTLHDAFVPDILYASITAHPEIHPSAATSPGGTPADPKILLPSEFAISLFNPDSTVILEHHHSALRGTYWEFTLPKTSFLPPTSSKLDAASAAAAIAHLPRATFRWRKEGGLMTRPQLRCSLVSPANLPSVPGTASSSKKAGANEPDIPIAMFLGLGEKKGIGEITIIQSNLKRVEVEDLKGLEVVLLLSAMAIGDIWFQPTNQMFNLNPPIRGSASGTARRKNSMPLSAAAPTPTVAVSAPEPRSPPTTSPQHGKPPPGNASFAARFQQQQQSHQRRHSTPMDVDAEYSRRLQEEEERRRRIAEKEQEEIRKMLAEEESRERRKREEDVNRETERLKRIYEAERAEFMARGARTAQPQRVPSQQRGQRPPVVGGGGGMTMPPPHGGRASMMPPPQGGRGGPAKDDKKLGSRKSFLGLKFGSSSGSKEEEKKKKLSKKGSSMF